MKFLIVIVAQILAGSAFAVDAVSFSSIEVRCKDGVPSRLLDLSVRYSSPIKLWDLWGNGEVSEDTVGRIFRQPGAAMFSYSIKNSSLVVAQLKDKKEITLARFTAEQMDSLNAYCSRVRGEPSIIQITDLNDIPLAEGVSIITRQDPKLSCWRKLYLGAENLPAPIPWISKICSFRADIAFSDGTSQITGRVEQSAGRAYYNR